MKPRTLSRVLAVAMLALAACAERAPMTEDNPMTTSTIVNHHGIAIDGFDPVSYRDGQPKLGRAEHELTWAGVRWRFATADNLARFARSPETHAPRYGGHCALAMSLGEVAPGSPKAAFLFKYLPGRVRAADHRWSSLATSSPSTEAPHGKASL